MGINIYEFVIKHKALGRVEFLETEPDYTLICQVCNIKLHGKSHAVVSCCGGEKLQVHTTCGKQVDAASGEVIKTFESM